MYRVTLTDRHYDLVRRFMVEHRLPNARNATQRMIEVAAAGDGGSLLAEVDDENDQRGRSNERLVQPRA